MHYFVNSAIASSASTPPVIEMGGELSLRGNIGVGQHDLVDLGGELGKRRGKN